MGEHEPQMRRASDRLLLGLIVILVAALLGMMAYVVRVTVKVQGVFAAAELERQCSEMGMLRPTDMLRRSQ